jgi:rod shape determining protein RodA
MGIRDNSEIKIYIDEVCSSIKCKDVLEDISLELESHIVETCEAYIEDGLSEDAAIEKAISNMGEAVVVGKGLDKVHKQKPDWSIIAISIAFCIFGLVCLYLIQSNGLSSAGSGAFFTNSLIYSLIGIGFSVGLYFFDYRKIYTYSKHLYYGCIVISFLLIVNGFTVNGLIIYIHIGNISINIPSLVLLLLTVSLSGIFCKIDWNSKESILYTFILFLVPNLLFRMLYSTANGIIYSVIFFVLIIASGCKIKQLPLVFAPIFATFYFYILNEPYRVKRIISSLNWRSDPQGTGYLNGQIDKIIYSAGIFGKGTSMHPTKLPMYHTDLILTYIIYTFGWVAFAAIVSLILVFIIRIINISNALSDKYGKLILYGLAALFSSQFVWNVCMTLGLLPMMGISLPFISYGGTSLVINFAAIGIICSIYRRKSLTNKTLA